MSKPMELVYRSDIDAPLVMRDIGTLLAEGDQAANRVTLHMTDGGTDADLSGCTGAGYFRRSDGNMVVLPVTVSGSSLTTLLPAPCYAYPGPCQILLQLEDSSGMVRTVLWLTGRVQQRGGGGYIDPGERLPTLDELLEQVESLKSRTTALETKTAALWNGQYEGRNLKTIFGSAEALHNAIAAGDFADILVGDYWPITLNGTIYDYAAGESKTLSNAVIKLEVAGIDFYKNYGDTVTPNHLLFCSRDLIPLTLMFRSASSTWYDEEATNPWLGSHLYQTFNNPLNGLLPLVAATDIGAYIYAGPNGNGMRFLGETKGLNVTAATSWAFADRGKIFLPSEREVWDVDIWSEHNFGGGLTLQWPIFAGTMRRIIKGLGNGGSRCGWWCCSTRAGNSGNFCSVGNIGFPSNTIADGTGVGVPLCLLMT